MSDSTELFFVSESWRWECKAISGMEGGRGAASGEDPILRGPCAESVIENKTDTSISLLTWLWRMLINANKTKYLGHGGLEKVASLWLPYCRTLSILNLGMCM